MVETAGEVKPSAAIGIQREDRILIRLLFDTPDTGQDCVLGVAYADGSTDRIMVSPTADAQIARQLDGVARRVEDNRGRPLPAFLRRQDICWTLPADRVVRGVVPAVVTPEGDQPVDWLTRYSLACRVPDGRAEFVDNMTFRRNRSPDEESLYRAAVDTMRHYLADGNMTPDAAPYVVNAYVVSVYKAIELGVTSEAIPDLAGRMRAVIAGLAPSDSIKEDRDVVDLSFLTARWHEAIHLGDRDLMMSTLEEVAVLSAVEREHLATFAFNASRGLLLLGLLVAKRDPRRTVRLMELTYARFRAAAAFPAFRASQLKDLSVSLEASILAMNVRTALHARKPVTRAFVLSAIDLCARAETPAFKLAMMAMIKAEWAATT